MSSPLFSRAALETISSWAEVLTVLLTMMGAASGVVYVLSTRPLRAIEAKESEQERQRTAKAQKEAADAQLALSQSLTSLARRAGDRVLNFAKFADGLKGRPKRTVEIWYKPDDTEVQRFSDDIYRALQDGEWPVSRRVLKPGDELGGIPLTKTQGIMVFSHNPDDVIGQTSFVFTLLWAIQFGGQAVGTTALELPEGTVVIVVGTKDKL